MAGGLYFSPEDFDHVITLTDLVSVLESIVNEIRASDKNTQPLINAIDNLIILNQQMINNMDLSNKEYKSYGGKGVQDLFEVYHQVIETSMLIRQLLAARNIELEQYNSVSYAFYYKGMRYAADTVNINWLRVGSDGTLKLNLNKAAEDLKQEITDATKQKIQEMFQKHYLVYLAAIKGMYRGKGLNEGHIAEAYEAHLAEHHPNAYQYLNTLNSGSIVSESLLASFASQTEAETKDTYWASHEDPDSAWIHVRGSLGTQRGTVAGDVGSRQVKSAKNSGGQVRLATLNTLKDGILAYSEILNPNIPSNQVAYKIARYISEPVSKTDKNIQAFIANHELSASIDELKKDKQFIMVHL